MLVLYLDESGDHNLAKIDSQFPMFALAGCVFDEGYHNGPVTAAMNAYKVRLFGTDHIILHTADISRNKNGFERLKDPVFRQGFYDETNQLIDGMDFKIIAAALRKDLHFTQYTNPDHPYHYCLEVIIERFFFMLNDRGVDGTIIAESRNRLFDDQLYEAFRYFMDNRTAYVAGDRLRRRIKDLEFRAKSANLAGLQVADLVVTPIARYVMGKKTYEDLKIIRRKFYCSLTGTYHGWGLKILP